MSGQPADPRDLEVGQVITYYSDNGPVRVRVTDVKPDADGLGIKVTTEPA